MTEYISFPKKILVGFNHTQSKLAYVTYYKEDGTLAKEKSFNDWIDKDIEIKRLNNTPFSSLYIYAFGGGDSYSHARLAYCEVEDPRGFRCQIKLDNLLDLIHNCECKNGMLTSKEGFIYGWAGTTLSIERINSEIYKNSIKKDNTKTLNVKECIPGTVYREKKSNSKMIYLGYFKIVNWQIFNLRDGRKESYLGIAGKNKVIPKYDYKHVFMREYEYNKYITYSSSKMELIDVGEKIPNLQEEIDKYLLFTNGQEEPIKKNLTNFNKFIIDDSYLVKSFDELPPENTYKHNWIIKDLTDDNVFYTIGYRFDKYTLSPGRKFTIKTGEDGKSYIYVEYMDGRGHNDLQWNISKLIEENLLLVFNTQYPDPANIIKVSDGENSIGFNIY